VAGAACAGDDALFADPARPEDPHLWARAQRLELDLQRFDADRRSEAARARVQRDFRSGVRAGVVTTPTLFVWEDSAARRVGIDELDPSRRRAGERRPAPTAGNEGATGRPRLSAPAERDKPGSPPEV
jgi:hypothetical protein